MLDPHFHEVWWIHSPSTEDWGGLRLAHFRKIDGVVAVIITMEIDQSRIGIRIWDDIREREQWRKVQEVPIPRALVDPEVHESRVHVSKNPKPIAEVWGYLSVDPDGAEGIAGHVMGPLGSVQLITASARARDLMKPLAVNIAELSGKPVRLARFVRAKPDLDVITPPRRN